MNHSLLQSLMRILNSILTHHHSISVSLESLQSYMCASMMFIHALALNSSFQEPNLQFISLMELTHLIFLVLKSRISHTHNRIDLTVSYMADGVSIHSSRIYSVSYLLDPQASSTSEKNTGFKLSQNQGGGKWSRLTRSSRLSALERSLMCNSSLGLFYSPR